MLAAAPRTANRLGVPVLRGHGPFITGNLIGSVGNGVLLPLGLLYFTDVQGLPPAQVGVATTVGQAIALPLTFLADGSAVKLEARTDPWTRIPAPVGGEGGQPCISLVTGQPRHAAGRRGGSG